MSAKTYRSKVDRVKSIRGFEALWDFRKTDESGYFEAHRNRMDIPLTLKPANLLRDYWGRGEAATMVQIPCFDSGPFGGSVFFDAAGLFSPEEDMLPYLKIDRSIVENTPLNVTGRTPFTLIAWIAKHWERSNHFIAGIWHEGTDLRDCSVVEPGQRQYALFGGLAANPGAVSGHISDTGAGSFGDIYARHLAATEELIPVTDFTGPGEAGEIIWNCVAMSYDPSANEVRAYLNGKSPDFWFDNPGENRFYSHHVNNPESYSPPASFLRYNGKEIQSMKVNPYWFDRPVYCPPCGKGGPFSVGRAVSSFRDAGFTGLIGGVALFSDVVSEDEMQILGSESFRRSL